MEETEDIIGTATLPRYKWARAEAKKIWKKHGKGIVPVMPDAIIQTIGIPCKEEELQMDGVSHFDENGVIFIMYKRNCAPVRKRFTLSHELGHIALDHVATGECEQHSNRSQEAEANAFANELLVPSDDLKTFMKQGYRTLQQVMARYQVSDQVAIFAVKNAKMNARLLPVATALGLI